MSGRYAYTWPLQICQTVKRVDQKCIIFIKIIFRIWVFKGKVWSCHWFKISKNHIFLFKSTENHKL